MPGHCTLLISDVHADVGSLEAILRMAGHPTFVRRSGVVKDIFNLGDVVERGYAPCEVIDRMKGMKGLASVLGNHDEAFARSTPVSGSDARSAAAHAECRARGGWEPFFGGMPAFRIDREDRLYLVHGGPIDPESVCPEDADPVTRWLCSRTWQRISTDGERYCDMSGYHYTPEDAFDAVRDVLEPGFAIVCGHEHAEAAFAERDGRAEDILPGLERASFTVGSRLIEEKRISLEDGVNYLVRLGIAGPAGYYESYGWDRCYFGAYSEDAEGRHISMLSFLLGRDGLPP